MTQTLETSAHHRAHHLFRAAIVRGDHEPGDPEPRAALEHVDPPKGLCDDNGCVLGGGRPLQLSPGVIVPVKQQREFITSLPECARNPRVHEPGIERNRCDREVIALFAGVVGDPAEIDEPVGPPVQVWIVDDEGRPRGRRLPTDLGCHPAEEMNQRKQGKPATRDQGVT
jgi:hypothetical protein